MQEIIVQKEIMVFKCDKCNRYGQTEKFNYPDRPECGSYFPYCDCEFGKWKADHYEHRDMFCLARQGG